ncbi:MAG: TatD family hydrolase [Candidatus Paceibacterota bacterium]
MSFEFFDSHSHLNLSDFESDKKEVIEKMNSEKVGTLTVGTSLETSKEAVRLAKENENLFACIGLHPNESGKEDFNKEDYEKLLGEKTICVGECGLDYFRGEERGAQEIDFRKQIDFALEHDLPLMLHIRPRKGTLDAYEDTLEILEEYKKTAGDKLRGQAHFFAGNIEIAKKFLDLGFYISFTGVITFTKDYDEVLKSVPLDRLLTETDSPFVAPVPHRGHRSEPQYVIEVYKKIAELKEVELEVFKNQVKNNLKTLYKIG